MSDADELKHCIEIGLGWEDASKICNIQPTTAFRRHYLECARHNVSQRKRARTLGLIDQMHELAKLGHTPWTISESLDVPYVSVEYWWYANGYNRD